MLHINKKYYPQKYVKRKIKMEYLINNDLSLSSSDESDNESDESDNDSNNEYDNESDK